MTCSEGVPSHTITQPLMTSRGLVSLVFVVFCVLSAGDGTSYVLHMLLVLISFVISFLTVRPHFLLKFQVAPALDIIGVTQPTSHPPTHTTHDVSRQSLDTVAQYRHKRLIIHFRLCIYCMHACIHACYMPACMLATSRSPDSYVNNDDVRMSQACAQVYVCMCVLACVHA